MVTSPSDVEPDGDGSVLIEPLYPDKSIPLVLRPAAQGIDLAGWASRSKPLVERLLRERAALLFRGFDVPDAGAFEAVAGALSATGLAEYRDSGGGPRRKVQGNVYTSTNFPPDRPIALHSDGLSMFSWPAKIFFFCVTPSKIGGETPVADLRRVVARIDPALFARFADQQILYVRNFGGGFAIPWQSSFQTADRAEVEALCHKAGIEFRWKGSDGLQTRQVCPAVATHPGTGAVIWFNQAVNLHISSLDGVMRKALLSAFKAEDLPINVYYGDGSPIDERDLDAVRAALLAEKVAFPWQKGDVLMLDNMLAAHGRDPFEGPREIVVAMADPLTWSDVQQR
jgi:alpha-ketoglutarate-dependent taurine dioxygenase